jgi:hypothetical protein
VNGCRCETESQAAYGMKSEIISFTILSYDVVESTRLYALRSGEDKAINMDPVTQSMIPRGVQDTFSAAYIL